MSFNNDYYLLTTVTIASILKNLSNKTYAHIHIIETGDFIQETRKKLQSLKYKINNNSEFIFYNGSKAIDDFGYEIKNNSPYGVGEYARLMAPDLINTDRIIIIDSGDVIVKKDLVEFYNMDLQDKLVWGIIDPFARCFNDFIMHNKENYINGGVLLFNSKKWREMEIYKDIINFYKAFKFNGRLGLPIQQILNTFLPYLSIGILPLKYNFQYHPYISAKCVVVTKEQVKEAQENEVIRHNNKMKPETGDGDVSTWFYYANLTGFINELCQKYPRGCRH
jgi:lipopolysaccharide biosynthesis glycosyltransferase